MPTAAGEWIWTPDPEAIRRTNVWQFMQTIGFDDREKFLRHSRENPERFWDSLVHEIAIDWFQPYSIVLDLSRGPEWSQWFLSGKLNIAWNCLDRHAQTDKTAILWEAENGSRGEISFAELQRRVNRFANALSGLGLRPGDRVAMCMPMSPEIVVVLYAV